MAGTAVPPRWWHQQAGQVRAPTTATAACTGRCSGVQPSLCLCRRARREPSSGRCRNTPLGCVSHLEGGLDVLIHHLDVGLVDGHGPASQPAGLVDWHAVQQGVRRPALLQDQKQFLQAQAFCLFFWGATLAVGLLCSRQLEQPTPPDSAAEPAGKGTCIACCSGCPA